MGFLIPVFAGVVLLLGSGFLLSTVGRRRRTRSRPLGASQIAAIEGALGHGLAQLVVMTVHLRHQIEDLARRQHELLAIERQLGGAPRRPLWRQIEDANFGQALASVRREGTAWLAGFDALPARDRQVIDRLAIDVAPIRLLVEIAPSPPDDQSTALAAIPHADPRDVDLHQLQSRLEAGAACLRRLELEISGYRGGVYR